MKLALYLFACSNSTCQYFTETSMIKINFINTQFSLQLIVFFFKLKTFSISNLVISSIFDIILLIKAAPYGQYINTGQQARQAFAQGVQQGAQMAQQAFRQGVQAGQLASQGLSQGIPQTAVIY